MFDNKEYKKQYGKKYRQRHYVKLKNKQRVLNKYKFMVKVIGRYKLKKGCYICGYNKHPHALQFDHINNNKHLNVSYMMHYNKDKLKHEISKCQILCANCHHEITDKRRKESQRTIYERYKKY